MVSTNEELNYGFNLHMHFKLMLNSVTGKLLNMIGTTWVCESTLSMINFMKSECRSNISNRKSSDLTEML